MTTIVPVAQQRILRATAATLTVVLRDADGEPADRGTVTVRVQRADGTDVLAAGTSTTNATGGTYTVALTASQTSTLDTLTATWTASGVAVATSVHEIVGGYLFSLAELRASAVELADTARYSAAVLRSVRERVERIVEDVCGVAFVPRHRRDTITGSGRCDLVLPTPMLRVVRSCSVDGVALSQAELDKILPSAAGLARRDNDGSVWTAGADVVIAWEHGYDRPPVDLADAAMRLAVIEATSTKGDVSRVLRQSDQLGGTTVFAVPGMRGSHVGIPAVDAVLDRYRMVTPGIA